MWLGYLWRFHLVLVACTSNGVKYGQDVTSTCITYSFRTSEDAIKLKIGGFLLEAKPLVCINQTQQGKTLPRTSRRIHWLSDTQGIRAEKRFWLICQNFRPKVLHHWIDKSWVTSVSFESGARLFDPKCLLGCSLLWLEVSQELKSFCNKSWLCSKKLLNHLFRCHCCCSPYKCLLVSCLWG